MSDAPRVPDARTLPEQPADWTELGAYQVVPGVHRIPLPMPSTALRAVNIYVLEGDDGLTVVDSGWAIPETRHSLKDALGELGHGLGDLRRFVITHAHHDHYTEALALRSEFACEVSIGRGERPSIERYSPETASLTQGALLRRCGAPVLAERFVRVRTRHLVEEDDSPWGPPDGWLDDEDVIDLGAREVEVMATPGHTRGHIIVRDVARQLLFAGDHLLPHITPSIGFEAAPERLPLASYLRSLRAVEDLPDAWLLPAHGPLTRSSRTRASELLAHHDARFAAVVRAVGAGASTAFEVAQQLSWTRHERSLDELDTVNQTLAVIETGAHLDVLALEEVVELEESDGVRHYSG